MSARQPKLVVVGNGMASARALEELLQLAPGLYDITVFGAEPHPNYNRILLSPILSGEQTFSDIVVNDLEWYRRHGIRLHLGQTVTRIDRAARRIVTADGVEAQYDRLLLATGSTPIVLPIPGADLDWVITYRDIADTLAMIAGAQRHHHAVVIGGGLLGLEAANGLRVRGMEVTVVHLMDWIMERQLDRTAAQMLQRSLEKRRIRFLLGRQSEAILGEGRRVRALRLKPVVGSEPRNGDALPADLVVMAVGIRPNTALAESVGLYCNRGIVVNDTMQTYDPRIYAVGECVSHRGVAYGLLAPLYEMARVCATHLAGMGIGRYAGSIMSTKLKVTGIDVFSAGEIADGKNTEEIVLVDAEGEIYKKLVIRDDRIVGGVLYGDTADGPRYLELLKEKTSIAAIRDRLMFMRMEW
jgi:nitrite reductase [NAD(P)H] large subunit